MITTTETNTAAGRQALFIKMVLSAWQAQNERLSKMLDTLSAEQLASQVAPSRNTGIYLAGHLIAASDGMLPLLGLGERLYPQLESIFLTHPDNPVTPKPAVAELKKYLHDINAALSAGFGRMQPEQWFERHTAVSAEDFAKEPHRNKLNIIISRTNHAAYHIGQLVFVKA